MTPQAEKALSDPKFYQMTPEAQQRVLATYDPGYGKLSAPARSQVLQMGQQKWGSSVAGNTPAALATSDTSAQPAPDLTTNTVDPTTGKGYGLYRMGSYDFNQGNVSKPEIQVPYNRVQDALAAGYKLHPDEVPRYQKDSSHEGQGPAAYERIKSLLTRMTEPMPDRPLKGSPFQQAKAALTNVGQIPFNVANRAMRGVAGLPQGVAQTAVDVYHGNPEGLDPATMAENSYKGLQQDTSDLGPMAALGNLGGDAATMYAAGELGGRVGDVGREVARKGKSTAEGFARAVTDTGKGPVERLIKEKQAANEKIDAVNQDRTEAHRQKQAAADTDYRGDLLRLRQKYEQSVRDATEKARSGTDADRAQVQSKNLAAKQKYDQAVREAQEKYRTKKAAAEQANAEAQRAHLQKIVQTAQHNRTATAAEQAKSAQSAQTQIGGSQLIYGLRQLDQALRTRANDLYGAVREKMAGASLPSDVLADAVKAAQEKWIRGSPEKVREFNAMLSTGEPGPELTLANQTAQNMGYKDFHAAITNPQMRETLSRALPPDVWQAAIGQGTKPISWNDLQGFYEETGAKIADGPQPGKADIYKALQQVHEEIGNQMQQLADAQGAGPQHRAARAFYREYMQTFHEPTGPSASGSPVAQALQAKDPEVAVAKFAGDSGNRGIANLRRYSDSLANLAQQVRQHAQEKITVPTRKSVAGIPPPEVKPVPAGASLPLPPVLEQAPAPRAAALPLPPVIPDAPVVPLELRPGETISSPDIAAARRAAAEARANKVWNRGQWAATWPIFQAARALWGGHIPSIPMMGLESAGMLATVKATTQLLRYPPMIRFLTQARPEDLALIPPELRGDLPGLVSQAQRQGIKVAPALVAAAGAAGGSAASRQGQQQPDQQQQPITPAAAMQAMQPFPTGAAQ